MYPEYKKVVFPFKNKDGSVTWVVKFPDLPGCSAVGNTEEDALKEAEIACQLWLDEYYEENNVYPEPREEPSYSGRLVLRLPKTLHQQLAEQAEEEGTSLNSLINVLLSQNYGKRISQKSYHFTFMSPPQSNNKLHDVKYEQVSTSEKVLKFA